MTNNTAAADAAMGKKDAAAFTKWGLNVLIGFEVAGEQTPRDLEWQLNQVLAAALARAEEREASRRRSA